MIKLKDLINESVVVKDGKVLSNGNLIGYYEFDRDSDSFWVNDVKKGKGQVSFETKREVEDYFKKNEKDAVKHLSKLRGESVNEASYSDTYFNSATDAVEFARNQAEKKGFEIDSQDWHSQITMGGRYSRTRPGVGKTNSFSIGLLKNGKPQRKNLNISLYGMESGKFELTYYIN